MCYPMSLHPLPILVGRKDKSHADVLRYMMLSTKIGNNKLNSAPQLRVLSPSAKAFEEHGPSTCCDIEMLHEAWPTKSWSDPLWLVHCYWWILAYSNWVKLVDVYPVQVQALMIIKCGCSPMPTTGCSCSIAQLSCSTFCNCGDDEIGRNRNTVTAVIAEG